MLPNDKINIVEARKKLSANTREDFRKAKEDAQPQQEDILEQ